MRSSREQVLALISRWQSENCEIKFVFCTVDHHLEISSLPMYQARLSQTDAHTFLLAENFREGYQGSIHTVYIKLANPDGYEITDISTEAHPTFQARVNIHTILRIPFGEFGEFFAYESEKIDPKKVM
jgi:hypothetical protein